MKNYKYLIALLFVLSLVTGMASGFVSPVRAQSEDGWTEPVNLSNSGSTTNPSMVVDSQGTIHVFWLDKIDGYKYANSIDGVTWSEPKTVGIPFSIDPESPTRSSFLAGPDGAIHILWQDMDGALQYSRADSSTLGTPSSWNGDVTLANSSVRFDAVVDSQGTLHVGYINNLDKEENPSGVYYRHLDGSGWSADTMIYPSKYYRSLLPTDDANIQLAVSNLNDAMNVYVAWDDRAQRRIFLAKSADGGKAWDGSFEVQGPDEFFGAELPFNLNLGVVADQLLLLWQGGIPGGDLTTECAQNSQWSPDGAGEFGQPIDMLEDFAPCPQSSQFILSDKDFQVVMFNSFNTISLMAWDGSRWSPQLPQSEIDSFINPVTLESVILGCQNASYHEDRIYLVGCDLGHGGDIWFVSRPVDAIDKWFPSPSKWSHPSPVITTDQKISSLVSVADNINNIHSFWVQTPVQTASSNTDSGNTVTIQYARWNGKKWSAPVKIISGLTPVPIQLTARVDTSGKLLLSWVDSFSGDMYFTWANSDQASSASEWETPIFIPSVSGSNSAPDIVTDSSGRMVIAFAVPINEVRGIYIVESDDLGTTWSEPYRIFDASEVDWHMVDQPKIALTGDGRLHVLFSRYALLGEQRQSTGLYYIQSSDGGVTWTVPELVSEQPVLWSELTASGESSLHRIWLEERKTAKVSLDQYSSDGGSSWSNPTILSTLTDSTILNYVSSDLIGNLYFQQLTGPDEITVLDQRWDQTAWQVQQPKELEIDPDAWNPLSIVSNVSSNGYLVVSLMAEHLGTNSDWQSEIVALSQFLDLGEPIPTPYPAMIAPAVPVQAGTQEVAVMAETPVPGSPLQVMGDTQSFWLKNRNLVGLLLLGGLSVFLVLLVLAGTTRSKKNTKNKTG